MPWSGLRAQCRPIVNNARSTPRTEAKAGSGASTVVSKEDKTQYKNSDKLQLVIKHSPGHFKARSKVEKTASARPCARQKVR